MNSLKVYLNEYFTGLLTQDMDGNLSFEYDSSYCDLNNAIPVSISMPLGEHVFPDEIVRPFFTNLLPEGKALKQISSYLNLSKGHLFSLLATLGGECSGAISLYPDILEERSSIIQEEQLLNEDELYDILQILSDKPLLAGESNIRFLLSGNQEKLPVKISGDHIILVKAGYPTTHILKTPFVDYKDSLHNEMFCLSLAELFGFNVPRHKLLKCKNIPYLLIERYDRTTDLNDNILKLHQEDLCQAMSILPFNKEESDGGPTLVDCLNLIDLHVKYPAVDKITFLRLIIFNYLIGNSNFNCKDVSLFYDNNKLVLAPFYNLFSSAVYEKLSPKLAMSIDGKYYSNLVKLNNWYKLVANNSTAQKMIEKELYKMANLLPKLAEKLTKRLNDEGYNSDIYNQIISIIDKRAKHILRYSQNIIKTIETKDKTQILENPISKELTDVQNNTDTAKIEIKSIQIDSFDEKEEKNIILQAKEPTKQDDKKTITTEDISHNVIKDKFYTLEDRPVKFEDTITINETINKEKRFISEDKVKPASTFDKLTKPQDPQIKPEKRPLTEDKVKSASTFDKLTKPQDPQIKSEKRSVTDEKVKPASTFDKLKKPQDLQIKPEKRPVSDEKVKPASTFDKLRKPQDPQIKPEKRPVSDEKVKPASTFDKLRKPQDSQIKEERRPITDDKVKPASTFDKLKKPQDPQIKSEKRSVLDDKAKSASTFDKLKKTQDPQIKPEKRPVSNEKVKPASTFDKLRKPQDPQIKPKEKPVSDNTVKPASTFDKLNKIDYDN